MAYYTGTAGNPAALQTAIETLCQSNGWSLTGGWLSKGSSYVYLDAPDTEYLTITGATGGGGAGAAPFTRALWVAEGSWPVTYYLFIWDNPDTVVCVINYEGLRCQVLFFADLVKIHNSAYIGGNYFFATGDLSSGEIANDGYRYIEHSTLYRLTDTYMNCYDQMVLQHTPCPIPFTSMYNHSNFTQVTEGLHAEIDGLTWINDTQKLSFTDSTIATLYRSPNIWNSQAHLIPMNIQFEMADSLYAYLGYFEHIRLVRIDNYDIGDIITISPDQWKVFPWIKKDSTYRNGRYASNTSIIPGISGTIGLAVRYDGP